MERPRIWGIVAACGLAGILVATLYPTPGATSYARQTPLFCLVCGENGGTDVILNLLLFIPFAIGLRLWGWSWTRVTLTCAALSFGVEFCQYLVIPGRDASLSDLITNTTGGATAAAVAPLLRVAFTPGRREAQRLLVIGAVAWAIFSVFTGWLFSPWVRDTPALSEHCDLSVAPGIYLGSIRSVALFGETMPNGILDARTSGWVADLFARESLSVSLDVVSQTPRRPRSWIYRLRVGPAPLGVNQQKTALVLEVPRRLAMLEVLSPTLRLDDGAPRRKGVPFTIRAGEARHRLWLESTVEGRTRRAEMTVTPTMAWGLIVPFGYAFGPEARVLTMIWLAGLVVPLGFWGAHTGRPVTAVLMIVLAIAFGLGLVPWLSQTGPIPLREWLAALLGAAAGWAARGPAAYLATRCGSPSASAFSSS